MDKFITKVEKLETLIELKNKHSIKEKCREILVQTPPGIFLPLLTTYIKLGKIKKDTELLLMGYYIRKALQDLDLDMDGPMGGDGRS